MKGNMERVLSIEAPMMYPKKWILLVNLRKERERRCSSGEVYWIGDSKMEIFNKAMEIGDEFGRTMLVEGFDDTPQIGGLEWIL